ncbi:MAG: pseudoazurin [Pseudomonadales bacterium]|nr:pseudoazurin [Pseudomonadales bacterium]
MRLTFIAIAFTLLFAGWAANATPPGSYDQIDERLAPFGKINRADGDALAAAEAQPTPPKASVEKVALSEGTEHVVEMLNMGADGSMVFQPSVIKVSLGDTVHFKATDLAHNSASIDGMVPEGAEAWAGQLSADISVTFNNEGIYVYQCDPHLVMAMIGVIQVGEPVNKEAIESSASVMRSQFAMNADRLERYLSQL